MTKQKLKIGLLLDNHNVPAWVYKMVEIISSSKHSEIALIIKKANVGSQNGGSFFRKIRANGNTFLYNLYSHLDYKLFKLSPDAFEIRNILNLVDCKEIEITVNKNGDVDHILSEDIVKIRGNCIDVLVNIGFQDLKGEILNCAKYGVWAYGHDTYQTNRNSFSGTWEVFEQSDVTMSKLQIHSAESNKTIYTSYSHTDELSAYRNKNNFYWKSSRFVPRKLEELYRSGETVFFNNIDKNVTEPPSLDNKKLQKIPNNYEILSKVGYNYFSAFKRKVNRLFYIEQWILLYKTEVLKEIPKSFSDFKRIVPPKDRIWADPFVIYRDNKYYIFIEEMLYTENKGKISVFEMDKNGEYKKPQVIIENDYHMSYPQVFADGEDFFMLPETGANRTIELYRCVDFPLKWKFEKTLMENVRAADATLLKHDGKYWLFTNMREIEGASVQDELFLFFTDDFLNGEWKPHPQNPIISDVRCSRPAGRLFKQGGRIYRPAQNGGKHYGYGMQIREIMTLSEEKYQERQVRSIYPDWSKDLNGTHTLNSDKSLTIIDGLIKRRR